MNDTSIAPAAETVPDFAGLIARIRHSVPQHCILSKVEDTRPYECDGLSLYRALPPVVVLPENEEQVVAVLQDCKAFNIPIVARGAGTGLSGGARPPGQGRAEGHTHELPSLMRNPYGVYSLKEKKKYHN